ncbi:hypothetical protein HY967_02360 [Candidatus Jorgensenbacteria bacterium]|nr:hypothetical protein [Candidatus Jorgensenbacteria bacterium]
MKKLLRYFMAGAKSCEIGKSVGMEVETQFVTRNGAPIDLETSQRIIREFMMRFGWSVKSTKGDLITEAVSQEGDKLLYELGRHNLEFSSCVCTASSVVSHMRTLLDGLYRVASEFYAYPFFGPVLETDENLLVIPDERDAAWLTLDGKEPLNLLARTSSVQFTVSVKPRQAIDCINKLGESISRFLVDYPQEALWRRYILESKAGYNPLRYGGPMKFDSIEDYCEKLASHDVVQGSRLVPYSEVKDLNIPLFLRSVWWYFRLRRYGSDLCIEVRTLSRKNDELFNKQLQMVLDILS